VCFGEIWLELRRAPEARDGSLGTAQFAQEIAVVVVGVRIVRVRLDCSFERNHGLVQPSQLME